MVVREDLDSEGRRYLPKTKIPFLGLVYSEYPNGQVEFEGPLESGLQHGFWVWWYPTGEKKSEITFSNHLKHGQWRSYFKSGYLQESGSYLEDKKEGLWTQYYESIKKLSEMNYKNDKLHGRLTLWHENGRKNKEVFYTRGKKHQWELGYIYGCIFSCPHTIPQCTAVIYVTSLDIGIYSGIFSIPDQFFRW